MPLTIVLCWEETLPAYKFLLFILSEAEGITLSRSLLLPRLKLHAIVGDKGVYEELLWVLSLPSTISKAFLRLKSLDSYAFR